MARKRRQRRDSQRRYHIAELTRAVVDKYVPRPRRPLVLLQAAWPDVAPTSLRTQAWPADLRRGEAVIHVRNSQWSHELTYLKQDLLARIQSVCPDAGVRSIRVHVGDIPADALPQTRVPPPPIPPRPSLGLEPPETTVAAVESVDDDALRHAIATARIALGSSRG